VSLQRRFGLGVVALGVGQSALAVATVLGPDSDALTGWSMAFLAVSSFTLGTLQVTGRLSLDVTDTHRRLLRVVTNALVVGGVAGTLAGVLLVADSFL